MQQGCRCAEVWQPEEEDEVPKQLLHLVFGGELKHPVGVEFADLEKLDIVGIYPDYQRAYEAWRGRAEDRRRRARPLFYRAPAPTARSGRRQRQALDLQRAGGALP